MPAAWARTSLCRIGEGLVRRENDVPGVPTETEEGHGPVPLLPVRPRPFPPGPPPRHLESRGIGHVRDLTIEASPLKKVGEVHARPADLEWISPGPVREGDFPLHHDLGRAELGESGWRRWCPTLGFLLPVHDGKGHPAGPSVRLLYQKNTPKPPSPPRLRWKGHRRADPFPGRSASSVAAFWSRLFRRRSFGPDEGNPGQQSRRGRCPPATSDPGRRRWG